MISEQLNDMADCLLRAACGVGTDEATCGFCGKQYGEAVPEGTVPDISIGTGEIAGTIVVEGCKCEGLLKYARFVLSHRYILADAIRAFAIRQKQKAEELKKILDRD